MLRPTIMAAGLLAISLTAIGAQAPNVVSPGDDFFAYANGDWLAATGLPPGTDRWTARNEINELARQQVERLLDDAVTAPAGSLARKVADFRAAWLDTAAIESKGIRPLAPLLDSINLLRDKAGLTRYLGRGVVADVDPLNWGVYRSSHVLGLSVEPGIRGEPTPVAFLLQGGLGLPDREDYLNPDPAKVSLRAGYEQYIARLLALAGFGHANRAGPRGPGPGGRPRPDPGRRRGVGPRPERRQPVARGRTSRAARPGWTGPPSSTPRVWQGRGRSACGSRRAVDRARGAGRVPPLDSLEGLSPLPCRPRSRRRASARLRRGGRGAPAGRGRRPARRARPGPARARGDAGGYGRRHGSAVRRALLPAGAEGAGSRPSSPTSSRRSVKRVEAASWMSPATQATALAKLDALYVGIGYPERWEDYSDLAVEPTMRWATCSGPEPRLPPSRWRAWAGRSTGHEWWLPPQTVGAILIFQQNAYNFPAALLQPPKYDPGGVRRRELRRHRRDRRTRCQPFRRSAGDGVRRRAAGCAAGGPPRISQRFHTAAEPLVRQFAAYQPLPGLAVDAKLPRSRTSPTSPASTAAFDAHRAALGEQAIRRGLCAAAGPGVLPRLRPELAEPDQRGGAAGAARLARPRARDRSGSPRCATSTRGTRRSMSRPGSGCISSRAARVRVW